MLALHDSEAAETAPDEEDAPPTARPQTASDIEKQYAQRCKALSYEVYSSIETLVTQLESGIPDAVSVETARSWLSNLRDLNCCLSQYARASVSRVDRLQVEIALAHNAMASDLLDREACHTTTLEAVTATQLAVSSAVPEAASQPSSSSDARPRDSVERAMQLVTQLRSSTAPFTAEGTQGYFGASQCLGS